MPYRPSPGRCIYCPSIVHLTDEHIIPQSLGGRLVLRASSCENCRRITSTFEQAVTRETYWPLRLRLGLKGSRKHKRSRPTHWSGILQDEDRIEITAIEVSKLPLIYCVPEIEQPGIYCGAPLTTGNPKIELKLRGSREELAKLLKEQDAGRFEIVFEFQWVPFLRMIAKICHAYAVSVVGLDGIDFYLPPLIRGETAELAHFVGGIGSSNNALRPPSDLALDITYINDIPHLVGRCTIFGEDLFPTYQAVVGKILDLDLVHEKMARER